MRLETEPGTGSLNGDPGTLPQRSPNKDLGQTALVEQTERETNTQGWTTWVQGVQNEQDQAKMPATVVSVGKMANNIEEQ